MNDEQRAALVDTVNTELMRAQGEYGQDHYFFGESSDRIMNHIDRLLADRAVPPVDDAERVDAAAIALCDFDVESNGGYVWDDRGDEWGSDYEYGRNHYRDMACAALEAAGAAPSLDAMLDSVHPKANVEARCISFPDDPVKWEAVVRVPIKGHVGYRSFRHDGPTRMAAIADAVAKARAQQKEGQ